MSHVCLPGTEHQDLPNDGWADHANDYTQGEMDQIDAASLVADFDVKGEFRNVRALIRGVLSAAPEEWRAEHFEPTINTIGNALEGYEATAELALSAPEIRAQYARATVALNSIFGRVSVKAWSFDGSPGDASAWERLPGQTARLMSAMAQKKYRAWQKELGERLKDAGLR